MDPRSLHAVPDDELLRRLVELVSQSRRVDAELVCHVGEVEARRLYAREASPSMFAYCTERLRLSEGEAYACIRVARAARRHPVLVTMLRDGRIHLSGLVRLVPHLTAENRDWLLERAVHRSKRQIEELVAELFPRPDVPTVVRRLPERWSRRPASAGPAPGVPVAGAAGQPPDGAGIRQIPDGAGQPCPDEGNHVLCPGTVAQAGSVTALVLAPADPGPAAPLQAGTAGAEPARPSAGHFASCAGGVALMAPAPRRAVVEPLSAARYKVQFTVSVDLRDKLDRLQALMRSEVPDGDLAAIIDRAVSEKLERLEARRYAKTRPTASGVATASTAPVAAPPSRYVPAAVRRAVLERDGSRCGYVDEQGRRCSERHRLEFHHRMPFAMGGDQSLGNISLRCKAHNLLLAEGDYGTRTIRRHLEAKVLPSHATGARPAL